MSRRVLILFNWSFLLQMWNKWFNIVIYYLPPLYLVTKSICPLCQMVKRMVGSIWHQHSHGSSEPNKYSLASSLLRVVPSSGSLGLKKFSCSLHTYISKCTNFYAVPWHIERYRWVFTTGSHVLCLDNSWITQILVLSPPCSPSSNITTPSLSKTVKEPGCWNQW